MRDSSEALRTRSRISSASANSALSAAYSACHVASANLEGRLFARSSVAGAGLTLPKCEGLLCDRARVDSGEVAIILLFMTILAVCVVLVLTGVLPPERSDRLHSNWSCGEGVPFAEMLIVVFPTLSLRHSCRGSLDVLAVLTPLRPVVAGEAQIVLVEALVLLRWVT